MMGFLIYVRGTKGIEPQKCNEIPRDMNNKPIVMAARPKELTAEQFAKPLRVLEELFPATEVS